MLSSDKWKAEKARKQAKLLELRRRKTAKESERLAQEVRASFLTLSIANRTLHRLSRLVLSFPKQSVVE
jgi:hypothetical protein